MSFAKPVSMKEHAPHIWMTCFYNHKPIRKEWLIGGIARKLTRFEKKQISGLKRYRNASHKVKIKTIKGLEGFL